MNLETLNRWLTLAANVGVMAGLIFLAYEIQQNTQATQLEAATNFQSSYSDIEVSIYGNPEFAALLKKGRSGDLLDETDSLRLWVFYNNVLRQWQFNHYQYLKGALDPEIWAGNRIFMGRVLAEDISIMTQWQSSKDMFSPAFNEMLESVTQEKKGAPNQ